MDELRGVITAIRWTCPEGSGNVIAEMRTEDDKRATVLGVDEQQLVRVGNLLLVVGRWRDHPSRGRQFHADAFIRVEQRTQDGVVRYLREVGGLTDSQARKMWRRWGERSVEVLRTEPQTVAAPGIMDLAEAAGVAARLQRDFRSQEVRVGLATLFAGRRFPHGVIRQCVDRWGDRAADVVRADPFLLLSLPSRPVGFARADALYLACGGDPQRLKRQTLLLRHLIETNRDGHTWVSAVDLSRQLVSYERIGEAAARPRDAIKLGVRARLLVRVRDAHGGLWLSTPEMSEDESSVSAGTLRLLTGLAPL